MRVARKTPHLISVKAIVLRLLSTEIGAAVYQEMMDFTEHLQPELVDMILSYLSPNELSVFSKCSVMWREVSNKDNLWLHHCMVRGWLRFGLSGELSTENHLNIQMNVAGNSPVFHLYVPEDSRLSSLCKWKNIFIRVKHLHQNWRKGRYTVSPMLKGHTEKVTAFACNGRCVVTGSEDKSLRMWDMSTASCLRKMDGHMDTITKIIWKCMCSHGQHVVTGSWDNTLALWDIEHAEIAHMYEGHSEAVTCCWYNGEKIVSGSADSDVRIWQISPPKCLHIMQGHQGEVYCLTATNSVIASGSSDSTVKVWGFDVKYRLVC
ncbi:FBXW7-like protein [Mya arenaria]|uniref:FBXW7-like protein n=1 Tax=Mya arenaria TaxID=6604 RepID=A0ABY7FCL3_MYAAR|nr:FBXW7-like protein [Mya arenaria]